MDWAGVLSPSFVVLWLCVWRRVWPPLQPPKGRWIVGATASILSVFCMLGLYLWFFSLMSSLQTSQWLKLSSSAGVMSFTCVYGLLYKMVWTCRHSCFQCYINQGENQRRLTATETLSHPLIRECQPLWQCLLGLISLLILTNTIGKDGVITYSLELFSHAMGNITPIIKLIGQMEDR